MSSIHYFQRYSQPENVATNNTLLLFSRLYQLAPYKFTPFLNELLNDADLQTGILFTQQVAGKGSIPDGVMAQESFKVIIETKLHNKFSVNQLTAHLSSFNNEQKQILLALGPRKLAEKQRIEVERVITESHNSGVKLISTTFQAIIDAIRSVLAEYDFELHDLVNDYEGYCVQSNLLDVSHSLLRIVPCGWSRELNVKYNVYFAPSNRGYTKHSYVGLYANLNSVKGMFYVGRLINTIQANLASDSLLKIISSTEPPTELQLKMITDCMHESLQEQKVSISTGHTFFCINQFFETKYLKKSKYGMQGTRIVNLKSLLGGTPSGADEVASQLNGQTWEETQ